MMVERRGKMDLVLVLKAAVLVTAAIWGFIFVFLLPYGVKELLDSARRD